MSSFNSVTICGNLGRDPESRFTASGAAVCTFSVATTTYRKDQGGEKTELTQWHRCVAYQRNAEIAGEYLKAGHKVLIQGKLNYRDYEDKAGVKKTIAEIIVDNLVLLTPPQTTSAPPSRRPPPTQPRAPQRPATTATNFDDLDDDVPF